MHIQCGMPASHNYRPSSAGASIYFSLAVAVQTAIEHLKLKLDSESIAKQAYRYRSMVSHLRRIKREELKRGRLCTGPHKEIYTIASEMVVERKTKLNEEATKDVNKEAQINTQEVTGKTIKNR